MKRIVFFTLILMLSLGSMYARQNGGRKQGGAAIEQGQNRKARIAQQIDYYVGIFALGESETAKFKELYQEYNKKLHAVYLQYRHEPVKSAETLTDEEIERLILDNFAQSRAILDIRQQYYKEFRTILTPSQINTIFEDEKARRTKMQNKAGRNQQPSK